MCVFHFAVLSFLLSAGCCTPLWANPKGFGTAKYALVIGCDGLGEPQILLCDCIFRSMKITFPLLQGGFYVNNATSFLPNIAKFYSKGATTAVARDQMPSVSAPNWGTIITGMGPEESGIQDNSWVPADDNPSDPTLMELPPISGAGKVSCIVHSRCHEIMRACLPSSVLSSSHSPCTSHRSQRPCGVWLRSRAVV